MMARRATERYRRQLGDKGHSRWVALWARVCHRGGTGKQHLKGDPAGWVGDAGAG